MSTPCHEQLAAAAKAALDTIAGVTGLIVSDNATRPVETLPHIELRLGDESPDDVFTGELGWRLEIAVTCLAKDRAGLALLRAKVQQALLADLTLGGLARDLRPAGEGQPIIDDDEGHPPAIVTELRFGIHYATLETDPFTFA